MSFVTMKSQMTTQEGGGGLSVVGPALPNSFPLEL